MTTSGVAWQTAERTRRATESVSGNGTKLHRCDFFGPDIDFYGMTREQRNGVFRGLLAKPEAPHGFLIQQTPNSEIPAHFHQVPQYQVIVHGGGRLGRHGVDGIALHYTDEYTAYGPILSDDDGIWYFTLRSFFDPGANYVGKPGARELMRPSPKRFLLVPPEQLNASPAAALAARTAPALDPVIAAHPDGVAAWMLRLGPGMAMRGPDPSAGGGQYYLVLEGALLRGGTTLPKHSLMWVSAADAAPEVCAGPAGLEAAVLQFPNTFPARCFAA
jgi:hypothetical protein